MRGAPHSGLSLLILRMSSRSSRSVLGRPTCLRDFQRQKARNPARWQRKIVSGRTDLAQIKQARHEADHPDQQDSRRFSVMRN